MVTFGFYTKNTPSLRRTPLYTRRCPRCPVECVGTFQGFHQPIIPKSIHHPLKRESPPKMEAHPVFLPAASIPNPRRNPSWL
jgi:hypothetical protein